MLAGLRVSVRVTILTVTVALVAAVLAGSPSAAAAPEATPVLSPAGTDISGAAWSEPDWCAQQRPVDDLGVGYDPAKVKATMIEIARRRYPPGVEALAAMPSSALTSFFSSLPDELQGDFGTMLSQFPLIVHEGGHLLTGGGFGGTWRYRLGDGIVYPARTTVTFPVVEIRGRHPDLARDDYAHLYLKGRTRAAVLNGLAEELNQYTHQLAAKGCPMPLDSEEPEYSYEPDRDGVLTMMWYVQTYLAIAREKHPADYRAIMRNRGLRQALIQVWRRAESWLTRTNSAPPGSRSAELEQRIREPRNIREIQLLADR